MSHFQVFNEIFFFYRIKIEFASKFCLFDNTSRFKYLFLMIRGYKRLNFRSLHARRDQKCEPPTVEADGTGLRSETYHQPSYFNNTILECRPPPSTLSLRIRPG